MRRTLVCNAHETVSAVTAKRILLDACGSRSCPRSGGDRDRRGPELDPERFRQQLEVERSNGALRETREVGQVLLVAAIP
jgi:hypothetical protein